MKKLLIIQNYNANKGDSSVVHTMKKIILDKNPNIDIALTSYDPSFAKEEYKLNSAEWLINFRNIKLAESKIRKIYFFLKEFLWIIYSVVWIVFYKVKIKLPIPKFKRDTIELYIDSEVVVLPGGHFFTNLNSFPVVFSHFYGLLFAKLMGKKTMIFSQTIGPFFGKFRKLTELMTNFIIKKTDIVTLREEDSLQYCKKYKNVFVTAETVFALPTNRKLAEKIHQLKNLKVDERMIIGVTIHHIYFKHFFSKDEYLKIMSNIFDRVIERSNCNILIIPMEASYHKGGDRPIAKEIRNLCKEEKYVHILDGDLDPIITSSVIANMDIFIGTKTHSIVYGLKSFVPTISISYQQKSTEFMKMFGVEENAINLKDLNIEKFMTIFNRIYENKEKYSKIQKINYEKVKNRSLQNFKYLLSLFNKGR
ncbi:colanic acid/amylovoran biosynthesis protein [Nitratiruptor sp. YY08-26]|uniref:polysaccharide pyruvyl transferase family protein n=1 Tax=unclassified Nitratiruptor TaxID=2624044 RepID=UPI0019153D66|nr:MULTISPECIES: polysaccharide pyruvyl transferase family protein [unclassified Nitratiruptor]BCD62076.1 colanic acid/amylovoran biosynthesis protein [Nitratiruptor sp. YY08-13]BCD66012.1 colanic acid/amylovoran biosynthesis protein [Nitratiruptor sp. YY08-26]